MFGLGVKTRTRGLGVPKTIDKTHAAEYVSGVSHEYHEHHYEPEPQGSGSRRGIPPRKTNGVAVLDPPVPPRTQPGPPSPIPTALIIISIVILLGIFLTALFAVFTS